MNTIIVDYDPFTIESRAYIMRDGKREESQAVLSDISNLTKQLTEIARKHEIYDIHVRGPLCIMYEIRDSIARYEMQTYEENKIKVEGL